MYLRELYVIYCYFQQTYESSYIFRGYKPVCQYHNNAKVVEVCDVDIRCPSTSNINKSNLVRPFCGKDYLYLTRDGPPDEHAA